MEKKEVIQWTGKNFDAVMQFAGEDGGHKLAYEDAEEEAYKTGRMFISSIRKWLEKGDRLQKISGGFIVVKGFFSSAPTEDKKAPVDEDVNKILSKHIKYFDSWPHLHSLCKSDVLNAYNAIPKAMQEFGSQERNRAIQQAIEIINDKLPFEFKTRFSPDYHEINIALEKLKKDS